MKVTIRRVDWEFKVPFRVAYRTRTHAQTVRVELQSGEFMGRGEALGVSYRGETADSIFEQLQSVAQRIDERLTRSELEDLLPAGGARHAVDCALWDLDAKRAGRRVWELAGIPAARPLLTALTLGADTPESMGRSAAEAARYPLLKLKLTGDVVDLGRVIAVREARPDARLIVDANQSWTETQLHELTPRFAALGVALIEQPFAVNGDDALASFQSPIPICADESCQTEASLPALVGKYAYVNIKLDKSGGLTGALRLAHAARKHSFQLMVGCMGGSSLSMAPAFVIGQLGDVVDLDGPLLARSDVPHAIRYDGGWMSVPGAELWG